MSSHAATATTDRYSVRTVKKGTPFGRVKTDFQQGRFVRALIDARTHVDAE